MGLFSKKDYICSQCGAKFQSRFSLSDPLCEECNLKNWEIQKQEKKLLDSLKEPIQGYVDYRKHLDSSLPSYTMEELQAIRIHRDDILKKYTISEDNRITTEELEEAGRNFKLLTADEALEVAYKYLTARIITELNGVAWANGLLLPTIYEGMLVETLDVFAACFTNATGFTDSNEVEKLMCALFTNDPYVPVVPMVCYVKKGKHDFLKSKDGRVFMQEMLTKMFDNLMYPVCDAKKLKKIIKEEANIKGNIGKEMMLQQLDSLMLGMGIFSNRRTKYPGVGWMTMNLMHEAGYLMDYEINVALDMEDRVQNQFWKKVEKMVCEEIDRICDETLLEMLENATDGEEA